MDIPVLLEPTPTGFRATTGAPFHLTAEAATANEAVTMLRLQIADRQAAGIQIVSITLPDPLFEHAARLRANPLFEDWARGVKEARRQREADEEAAEAAGAPAPADRNGHPAENPTATEPAT